MRQITTLLVICFSFVVSTCNASESSQSLSAHFEALTVDSLVSNKFTIELTQIPFDAEGTFDETFLDENKRITLIYHCDKVCKNISVNLSNLFEEATKINCEGMKIVGKLTFSNNIQQFTSAYVGEFGKDVKIGNHCWKLNKPILEELTVAFALF